MTRHSHALKSQISLNYFAPNRAEIPFFALKRAVAAQIDSRAHDRPILSCRF